MKKYLNVRIDEEFLHVSFDEVKLYDLVTTSIINLETFQTRSFSFNFSGCNKSLRLIKLLNFFGVQLVDKGKDKNRRIICKDCKITHIAILHDFIVFDFSRINAMNRINKVFDNKR